MKMKKLDRRLNLSLFVKHMSLNGLYFSSTRTTFLKKMMPAIHLKKDIFKINKEKYFRKLWYIQYLNNQKSLP